MPTPLNFVQRDLICATIIEGKLPDFLAQMKESKCGLSPIVIRII